MLWVNSIYPEGIDWVLAEYGKAQNDTKDFVLSYRIVRKDQVVWIVEARTSWLRDQYGNVISVNGFIYDITDRVKMAKVLKELQFRTIFNDAPLGIALVDSLKGKFHETNEMFAKIVGRSKNELASLEWSAITHPDDIQKGAEKVALLVQGKINGFQLQKRYIRPGGSIVWINLTVSRLIEEPSSPLRHICMIEDITERIETEAALSESEEKYHTLYESMKEGVITTDLIGNILECNQACLDMLGYTLEELKCLTY